MDIRGAGFVIADPNRLQRIEEWIAKRYKVTLSLDGSSPFGRIDEVSGTIHLNPGTATYDVLAHELSHVRFAVAIGKWGNGLRLSNCEVNLMEAIGYYGTYRKCLSSGFRVADALAIAWLGPAMAQSAIQAMKTGSPEVVRWFRKAIAFYGREYTESALRFAGKGLDRRKSLNLP